MKTGSHSCRNVSGTTDCFYVPCAFSVTCAVLPGSPKGLRGFPLNSPSIPPALPISRVNTFSPFHSIRSPAFRSYCCETVLSMVMFSQQSWLTLRRRIIPPCVPASAGMVVFFRESATGGGGFCMAEVRGGSTGAGLAATCVLLETAGGSFAPLSVYSSLSLII